MRTNSLHWGSRWRWGEQKITKSCFIELKLFAWMEISACIPPLTDTDSHLLGSSPSLIEQSCQAALWGFLRPGRSARCIQHETDTQTDGLLGTQRHMKNPLFSHSHVVYFTFFQSILTSAWRLCITDKHLSYGCLCNVDMKVFSWSLRDSFVCTMTFSPVFLHNFVIHFSQE